MALYQSGTLKINGGTIDTYATPFNIDVIKFPFDPANYSVRFFRDINRNYIPWTPYVPYLIGLYYLDVFIQYLPLGSAGGEYSIYSEIPSISWDGATVYIGAAWGLLPSASWNSFKAPWSVAYTRPTTALNGVSDPLYQVVAWE